MPKKLKSIYFEKVLLSDFLKQCAIKQADVNNIYIAIPENETHYNLFKKIWNGTFKAFISNIRITWKHKNFFRKLNICIQNGAIEKLITRNIIKENVINTLLEKVKEEEEVLRYILKWMFLPLEEEILPDGKVIMKVASQAFDELDELYADELFNKVYDFLADMFDISRYEFNKW